MNLNAALTSCGMLSSAWFSLTFSICIMSRILSCTGAFKTCKPKSEHTFSKYMEDKKSLYMHLPQSLSSYGGESHLGGPSPLGPLIQSPGCDKKNSTRYKLYWCGSNVHDPFKPLPWGCNIGFILWPIHNLGIHTRPLLLHHLAKFLLH